MSERKTLKINETTKARLGALKNGQTWDGLLNEMAEAYEQEQRRGGQQGPPTCVKCGATVTKWTIVSGDAMCEECAPFEFDA